MEPSCFFIFLCPPLHIALKNRDAGFVSLCRDGAACGGPGEGQGWSQPRCRGHRARCFADRHRKGAADGDFAAARVAQRPRRSLCWGWGCHQGRNPSAGSRGAAEVRPVPQRVCVLARFESAVVDRISPRRRPGACRASPEPSRWCRSMGMALWTQGAARGLSETHLCSRARGPARGSPQRTSRLMHKLCACAKPVPSGASIPVCSLTVFLHASLHGGNSAPLAVGGRGGERHGLSPRPCLLTLRG